MGPSLSVGFTWNLFLFLTHPFSFGVCIYTWLKSVETSHIRCVSFQEQGSNGARKKKAMVAQGGEDFEKMGKSMDNG